MTTKDLSNSASSVTAHFVKILPDLNKVIADISMSDNQKRDDCLVIAIQALNISDASNAYYTKTREALMRCRTAFEIRNKVLSIIENGKNYSR